MFQPNEGYNKFVCEKIKQEEYEIKLTTIKEVAAKIKENINHRKHLGLIF